MSDYAMAGKRLVDVAAVLLTAPVTVPLLLATAAVTRLMLGGPVLFRQRRIGRRGREFNLVKFRTMTNATDATGELLPDHLRLTTFGRFLRSTSLDELPELWNILRGEMSLVGPRPLLPEYLPLYSPEQARRHEVRPGLTGLAQVEGRNATSWEERLSQDVAYVDQVSLWLDASIVLRTVACVLRRDGVSAEGHATMPAFTGSVVDTDETESRLKRSA